MTPDPSRELFWPALEYEKWKETLQSVHRWTQIVGKIRLSKSPWINHGWHSTLFVSERGLTTSIIHDEIRSFSIELDFLTHVLRLSSSDGHQLTIPLRPMSVSSFYHQCIQGLAALGINVTIHDRPNELPDSLAFPDDEIHRAYDEEYANRCWRILLQCDRVMKEFRSWFSGKVSPVHFFWGAFDLAVTRFSGRRAPEHPGGIPHLPDLVTREAYSDEVSSCGFWPGNELFPEPAFYSYAYPAPAGFESAPMPTGAYYHQELREFILPYETVRSSPSPDVLLLEFFQKSYEAAAEFGNWDRANLEESPYLKLLHSQRSQKKTAA